MAEQAVTVQNLKSLQRELSRKDKQIVKLLSAFNKVLNIHQSTDDVLFKHRAVIPAGVNKKLFALHVRLGLLCNRVLPG